MMIRYEKTLDPATAFRFCAKYKTKQHCAGRHNEFERVVGQAPLELLTDRPPTTSPAILL